MGRIDREFGGDANHRPGEEMGTRCGVNVRGRKACGEEWPKTRTSKTKDRTGGR